MSRPVVFRRAAVADMDEVREWYDLARDGLGQEFLDDARAVLTRIGDTPLLYAAGRGGVRKALLGRFPYVVIYRVRDPAVEVVAVVHTSRHPRAWRSRL